MKEPMKEISALDLERIEGGLRFGYRWRDKPTTCPPPYLG